MMAQTKAQIAAVLRRQGFAEVCIVDTIDIEGPHWQGCDSTWDIQEGIIPAHCRATVGRLSKWAPGMLLRDRRYRKIAVAYTRIALL